MAPNRGQLNERATALLRKDKRDEYLALTQTLVQKHPTDAAVRLHYGTALRLTRPEHAAEQIRAAVELAPSDPIILTRAASLLFDLDEFELSQEYVSRAGALVQLSEFVLGTDLVHLAGMLAARQRDDERARTLLQAAVDVGPEDRGHARYAKVLARFLAARGNIEAAREVVTGALKDHPDDEELQAMIDLRLIREDGKPVVRFGSS